MDANKLHLLLNYYPLLGMFLGIVLLIIGLWRKNEKLQRCCLWFLLAIALLTLPVYVTGEITGKEMGQGMFAELVKGHQTSGQKAFIFTEIMGFAAVIGLFLHYRHPQFAKWGLSLVLILSLVSAFFITKTALLGRGIKYGLTGKETKTEMNFHQR